MRVGVLGGGQLGRMLALAGIPLGMEFRFFDSEPDAPAGDVGELIQGSFDDSALIERFADGLDVVTFEFENVPASCVRQLETLTKVSPGASALEIAQDRLSEKNLFRTLDIPTPPFYPIELPADLDFALGQSGYPGVLKTRRFGYDGKGQWVIQNPSDLTSIRQQLPDGRNSLILEGFVNFDRELSQIAARSRNGDMVFYPLVENHHRGGILRLSLAPAPDITDELQETAQRYAVKIAEALDYVGIITVELFQRGGELLANEIAPRVHNSGHWTIEAAETSQFENHLRAILDLPLGATAPRGTAAMWNVLGFPPQMEETLKVPGAHLHLYGKEPRAGRKIGHITLCSKDRAALTEPLERIRALAPQS
jgi:5-(carboxyamino)imidazole ribonucleotide synthase